MSPDRVSISALGRDPAFTRIYPKLPKHARATIITNFPLKHNIALTAKITSFLRILGLTKPGNMITYRLDLGPIIY